MYKQINPFVSLSVFGLGFSKLLYCTYSVCYAKLSCKTFLLFLFFSMCVCIDPDKYWLRNMNEEVSMRVLW
jgi:hypothetical protein